MTLMLELTPEQEERLRREAALRGQDMTDYARAVLLPEPEGDEEFWRSASSPALAVVWDNAEDDVYAKLLPK